MRILVIGASGRAGREVVTQARERGHHVTAFVRRPEAFDLPAEAILAGDVLDRRNVHSAARGASAVVCVLGPGAASPADLCSRGTRHVIDAMQRWQVDRLVCVTGARVGHPRDKLVGWVFPLRAATASPRDAELLADRRAQEAVVQASGLAWTIVRPPRLSGEPLSRNYRVGEDLVLDSFTHIGRADLASFLVDQIDDDRFVRRGVAVAY
jgi:putative NADH-flavin reductase